ncbi:MAG TPA: glutamate synthase, partial [Spirochaetota bacterium]|nr:glutamate synthase [Spirochaetota bacterium]
MGKTTGFMEYERKNGGYRPVEERIKDYREVIKMLPKSEVTLQGARCMDCGIPFCHSIGCPLYNLIPEWNDAVYNNDYQEALDRLLLTNNFPEITGRICPAPCEDACTLAINRAPVAVKEIELAIIEEGFRQGWVKPQQPSVRTDQ